MNFFKSVFLLHILTVLGFSSVTIINHVEIKNHLLCITFNKQYSKDKIKSFTLSEPNRIVYDFKHARLKNIHIGKKFNNTLRIAQYRPNTTRIVIESDHYHLKKPYIFMFKDKEYHIPLTQTYQKNKSPKKQKIKNTSRTINEIFSTIENVKHISTNRYTKVKITTPIQYNQSNNHDLIVIDAGHGGHDSGATSAGKREKDLVLSIAKKVSRALKRRGYSVYLTRSKDRFLKLSQRTKIADKKRSVAFISIHANSVPKHKRSTTHGIETFFLQTTRDAKSQRIAARENAAVLKEAGSSLSKKVIIDSVLNGPKIIESNKLAIAVQRRIITNIRSRYKGIRDGGVRHAPFYVLVGASRPSILVEVGYISHPRERKRLFTPSYQNLIAKGIAEGINNYLLNRKKEIDIE